MNKNIDTDTLYKTADKFISLANAIAQDDSSGTVGMALRFAAARYSSFESSLKSKNMAEDKEKIKEELLKDYALMLDENLETYIRHLDEKKAQKANAIAQNKTELKVLI